MADTVLFLTSSGLNSWTVPSDWNPVSNRIECIGAGGSGAAIGNNAVGGGGGAYATITNISLTAGSAINYFIGAGGPSKSTNTDGTAGEDTFFNSSSFPTSGTAVGAKGGAGGLRTGAATLGGQSSACYASGGSSNNAFSGGTATFTGGNQQNSGGGAAGPNGNGIASSSNAGGAADAGIGGAGGTSGSPTGGAGTEWTANKDPNNPDGTTAGSGGGGWGTASAGGTAGTGGFYGGGGGGNHNSGTSGAGKNGIIVITYTPLPSVGAFSGLQMTSQIRTKIVGY